MKPLDFSNHRSTGTAPNIAARQAIAALAALGWSGQQIANHLGMSRNAVMGHCFRGGIKLGAAVKPAPEITDALRTEAEALIAKRLSLKTVVTYTGLRAWQVTQIAKDAGLVFANGQQPRRRAPRLANGATLPAVRGLADYRVEDAAFAAENAAIALPEFNPYAPRPAREINNAYDASRLPGVALTDLERGACRWPLNDPARGQAFLFCAAPIAAPVSFICAPAASRQGRASRGQTPPYCACHAARAVSVS